MKLVINETDFNGIGTAVFYESNKILPKWIYFNTLKDLENLLQSDNLIFNDSNTVSKVNELPGVCDVPDNSYYRIGHEGNYIYALSGLGSLVKNSYSPTRKNWNSTLVYYHGSTESLLELSDFTEYDFSYIVEKYKFNDNLLVNQLDSNSAKYLGTEVENIMLVNDTLFPSLIDEADSPTPNFFGTVTSGVNNIYLFPMDANYDKVELYEGVVNENSNDDNTFYDYDWMTLVGLTPKVKPVITIYLGPESNSSHLEIDKFFDQATYDYYNKKVLTDSKQYLEELDEITNNKVLVLVVSDNNHRKEINLSAKVWNDDKNGNRNKPIWTIRNDEFFSTVNNVSLVDKKQDFFVDARSNAVLGNKVINNHILLDRIAANVDDEKYYPFITYNSGDQVKLNDVVYESVINGNKGNDPRLSKNWVIADSLKILNSRSNVILNHSDAGYVIPGGQITVTPNLNKVFIIHENLGYELDKDNPCSSSSNNNIQVIVTTYKKDGKTQKQVSINDPDAWNSVKESGQLIFNFNKVDTKIRLVAVYDGQELDYNNWVFYGRNRLELQSFTGTLDANNSTISIPANEILNMKFNDLLKNSIDKVEASCVLESGEIETRIITAESGNYTDKANYTSATYKIYVSREIKLIISENIANYEIEDPYIEVPVKGEYTYRFYPCTEGTNKNKFNGLKVKVINSEGTTDITDISETNFSSTTQTVPSVAGDLSLSKVDNIYSIRFLIVEENITIEFN